MILSIPEADSNVMAQDGMEETDGPLGQCSVSVYARVYEECLIKCSILSLFLSFSLFLCRFLFRLFHSHHFFFLKSYSSQIHLTLSSFTRPHMSKNQETQANDSKFCVQKKVKQDFWVNYAIQGHITNPDQVDY